MIHLESLRRVGGRLSREPCRGSYATRRIGVELRDTRERLERLHQHRADSQPVEPCLVGTRNCMSADQPTPGPCLVSTARCVVEGMRVTDAVER
jgi:hypothetical protein